MTEFGADWVDSPVGHEVVLGITHPTTTKEEPMPESNEKPIRFAVVCPAWPIARATKRRTREAAEKDLAEVIKTGGCHHPHEIVEV